MRQNSAQLQRIKETLTTSNHSIEFTHSDFSCHFRDKLTVAPNSCLLFKQGFRRSARLSRSGWFNGKLELVIIYMNYAIIFGKLLQSFKIGLIANVGISS